MANARTNPQAVREDVEQSLGELGIAVLDALVLQYVKPEEDYAKVEAALKAAHELKAAGTVRHVAASTHSFDLACKLASSRLLDCIMLRYNMAHRTVEKDAFPTALACGVPVFSFTSTRWNTLQGGHKRWDGELPDTGDCIDFALAHPAVAHNISSIRTLEELETAASTLARLAELGEAEHAAALETWREYGTLVHDDQENLVETDYVERIRDVYAAGNSEWNFDNMGTEDDPTSENAVLGAAHGEREEDTEGAKL